MEQTYALTRAPLKNILESLFHPTFVLTIMGLACGVFVVISIILLHHWRTHGVDVAITQRVTAIYFSGGFILIGAFIVAAIQLLG